jgi:hypothetical protein
MLTVARVRGWTLQLFASLLVMTPVCARAQVVATSFSELEALVRPGDRIEVVDAAGRKTKGTIGELSASTLELLVRKQAPDGRDRLVPQAHLAEGDVRQIRLERRDSLLNGTLIGFAPGGAIGVLILFVGAGCDCYTIESRAGIAMMTMLFAGGIGAGIGAVIDASMIDRTTVYYAPSARGAGLHVQPLITKTAAGVQLGFRF